jgi:hypothetical protein
MARASIVAGTPCSHQLASWFVFEVLGDLKSRVPETIQAQVPVDAEFGRWMDVRRFVVNKKRQSGRLDPGRLSFHRQHIYHTRAYPRPRGLPIQLGEGIQ